MVWVKGLMKVFSNGLAILREWGMIGLLKGCVWENVRKSFGRYIVEEVDWYSELMFEKKYKKRFGCWQLRGKVHDKSEWQGFVKENGWGVIIIIIIIIFLTLL